MTATAKVRKLKAVLAFKEPDSKLLTDLNTILERTTGNPNFSNPPFDLATVFKPAVELFSVALANAADGGKKAISDKRKARQAVVKLAQQLGHYVEAASNNDPTVFNTSGFTAASTTKTAASALNVPAFKYIDRGANSGQITVRPAAQKGVLHFDVRYGIPASAGAAPATWTVVSYTSSKVQTISGLTPGSTYVLQIRAMGKLGYTDWSDSMTFICG